MEYMHPCSSMLWYDIPNPSDRPFHLRPTPGAQYYYAYLSGLTDPLGSKLACTLSRSLARAHELGQCP